MLPKWRNNIYTALCNNKTSPKDCDTHKFIILNYYPYRYGSLYCLIRYNHTNNLTHPIDLIFVPPKINTSISKDMKII